MNKIRHLGLLAFLLGNPLAPGWQLPANPVDPWSTVPALVSERGLTGSTTNPPVTVKTQDQCTSVRPVSHSSPAIVGAAIHPWRSGQFHLVAFDKSFPLNRGLFRVSLGRAPPFTLSNS